MLGPRHIRPLAAALILLLSTPVLSQEREPVQITGEVTTQWKTEANRMRDEMMLLFDKASSERVLSAQLKAYSERVILLSDEVERLKKELDALKAGAEKDESDNESKSKTRSED